MNGREGSGALRQEAPCPTTARDHEDGRFYANVTKPSPAPEQLSIMNMYAAPAMTSTLMMFVVVQYFVAPWPRRARGRGPRACANQLQAGAVKRRAAVKTNGNAQLESCPSPPNLPLAADVTDDAKLMLRARGTRRADAPCAVLATGMRMGVERGGLTPARWTEAAQRVPCLKQKR